MRLLVYNTEGKIFCKLFIARRNTIRRRHSEKTILHTSSLLSKTATQRPEHKKTVFYAYVYLLR